MHFTENSNESAKQLIASLAVAESALEFEHRDLHCNNVLILETKEKSLNYKINGKSFKVELNGFKLNIIDTTYSRIKVRDKTYFNDLTKAFDFEYSEQLTDSQKVYLKQSQLTQNDWSRFCPKSNILWCHLILKHISSIVDKSVINQNVYSRNDFQLLQKWTNTISKYNSVFEFLTIMFGSHSPVIIAHTYGRKRGNLQDQWGSSTARSRITNIGLHLHQ